MNKDKQNYENIAISYEFFPPKDFKSEKESFLLEVSKLSKCNPSLISLTCSACGKNSENTDITLCTLTENFDTQIMPHLTCICNTKDDIDRRLETYKNLKCKKILALRGDEPTDGRECFGDFKHADELVKYIKSKTNFDIAVAGYPEGHFSSPSIESDLKYLQQKVNFGATEIYTQMFFDNNKFYKFVDSLDKLKIKTPVIAGIMPVISYNQLSKMTQLANITIPNKFKEKLEKYKNTPSSIKEIGIEYTTKQCQDLILHGVRHLHFFTLNHAYSTLKILEGII